MLTDLISDEDIIGCGKVFRERAQEHSLRGTEVSKKLERYWIEMAVEAERREFLLLKGQEGVKLTPTGRYPKPPEIQNIPMNTK